jgi:hypothetical protein
MHVHGLPAAKTCSIDNASEYLTVIVWSSTDKFRSSDKLPEARISRNEPCVAWVEQLQQGLEPKGLIRHLCRFLALLLCPRERPQLCQLDSTGPRGGKLIPYINFILLAWIRAKNIKFRYVCDGSFVDHKVPGSKPVGFL